MHANYVRVRQDHKQGQVLTTLPGSKAFESAIVLLLLATCS